MVRRRPMRRFRRRGRRSTKAVAYKALKLAKKANKLPELKQNEITWSATSVSSSGTMEELSVVAAGTGNNQKVGDRINPTSLRFRGTMNIHASATSSLVRLIIFRWNSGLFTTTVGDILVAGTIKSFKSQDKRFESEILYDRVFKLNSVERPELFFQGKLKLKKPIAYAGGASAANRNSIGYLILSDEATNTPTVDISSRMWFRDV